MIVFEAISSTPMNIAGDMDDTNISPLMLAKFKAARASNGLRKTAQQLDQDIT